jgi:hypothetical protein
MAITSPLSQNVKVFNGNRITIELASKIIGLAQSCRATDNYNLQPASGIGDIHVIEWVPTMAQHSVAIQTMFLYKAAMQEAGLVALEDIGDGHVFENGLSALRGIVFDISIRGKSVQGVENPANAEQVLRKYQGCSYDGGDIDVGKHAIVVRNATFRALDVTTDESQSNAAG